MPPSAFRRRRPHVRPDEVPADKVIVHISPQTTPSGEARLYDGPMSLQAFVDRIFDEGLYASRRVTGDASAGPFLAGAAFITDYRRNLGTNEVGSSGTVSYLSYGTNEEGGEAGGYGNATVIGAIVRGSDDDANEVGGCVASLQIGADGDERPVLATLWGSSYTVRGFPGVRPGALMAYTAVVQNYFDGPGSRSCNYGYAAVTRPGIGDGADFWNEPGVGFRYARTHPVDVGFIVCGDSGDYPNGGDIGFRVAFQAGGEASPWAPPGEWRTRIGTGLVVQDWLDGGVRVRPPHDDADLSAPHVRLDASDADRQSFLECRVAGHAEPVMAVRGDGRILSAPGREPEDVVTKAQLEAALGVHTGDEWHDVGGVETPWANGWSAADERGSRFYRDGSRGYLELAAVGGSSGSTAFVLPSPWRPDRSVQMAAAARGTDPTDIRTAVVSVDRSGAVFVDYPHGSRTVVASASWRLASP